jgi:hypothetical protein
MKEMDFGKLGQYMLDTEQLFGHCIVYPSIYGFLLQLWYLQTFLSNFNPEPWNKQGRRSKHLLLYAYSLLVLLCLRHFHV